MLERMRLGDRSAVAEFVDLYGRHIRLRLRHRLGASIRRVFDSDDLVSTICRRLDSIVADQRVSADNEARLWSLVAAIGSHAICEQARALGTAADGADIEGIPCTAGDDGHDFMNTIEIDAMLREIPSDIDRVILLMRIRGVRHGQIARVLGLTSPTVRMRWRRMRHRCRACVLKGWPEPGGEEETGAVVGGGGVAAHGVEAACAAR